MQFKVTIASTTDFLTRGAEKKKIWRIVESPFRKGNFLVCQITNTEKNPLSNVCFLFLLVLLWHCVVGCVFHSYVCRYKYLCMKHAIFHHPPRAVTHCKRNSRTTAAQDGGVQRYPADTLHWAGLWWRCTRSGTVFVYRAVTADKEAALGQTRVRAAYTCTHTRTHTHVDAHTRARVPRKQTCPVIAREPTAAPRTRDSPLFVLESPGVGNPLDPLGRAVRRARLAENLSTGHLSSIFFSVVVEVERPQN